MANPQRNSPRTAAITAEAPAVARVTRKYPREQRLQRSNTAAATRLQDNTFRWTRKPLQDTFIEHIVYFEKYPRKFIHV
jgi:hypothetical protein